MQLSDMDILRSPSVNVRDNYPIGSISVNCNLSPSISAQPSRYLNHLNLPSFVRPIQQTSSTATNMSYLPVLIPGKFGFGSMSLTWAPAPVPFEKAFASIQHCLDNYDIRSINGGEFYGPDLLNLKLLGEFWEKYGEKYPGLVIAIKGAVDVANLVPNGSKESIDRSVANILRYFPQEKAKRPTLVFEIARVDPNVPYDETIGYIAEHVKAGNIDGVSLSEVGQGSISKASNVFPISCVEVEFSLMCQDIVENGVLELLSKLQVPIVAYSPLCRGFLTDSTSNDPESFHRIINRPGDFRGHIGKFSGENFWTNIKVVQKLQEFAKSKGTSLESLALSWILAISELENFNGIPKVCKIIPIPSGSTADKIDKNLGHIVDLTVADLKEIEEILKETKVVGARYNENHADFA